jgi:glycoside/pentoside/hexuronide:cation symporter, GPH family
LASSTVASLPLRNRLLYASGSFGSQLLVQTLTVWIFYFYVAEGAEDRDVLAPELLVGLAMTLGRLLDALTDPVMGYLSDITRSRWGRRYPFIILGAPFMGLMFLLLWLPPVDGNSWVNALWLGVIVQFYFLGVTIVGAPYSGIFPELAITKEDRVSISAWQLVFGLMGAGVALIATGPLIEAVGFVGMATFAAIAGTLPRYIGLLGVRGRLHYQPPVTRRTEFAAAIFSALRFMAFNRNFLSLVGSLVCFSAGLLMVTQSVPFFVTEIVGRSEAWTAPVTAAFFVSALAIVPLVVFATRRRDKRQVYLWCLVGASLALPLLFFAGFIPAVPSLLQVIVIIALVGLPLSGIFILPDALLADVVDDHSARTDTRREAMYFSSRATLEKFGQAFATGIFAILLASFGRTADEPMGIRLMGPTAGMLTFIGFLLFAYGYRITEPADEASPTDDAARSQPRSD